MKNITDKEETIPTDQYMGEDNSDFSDISILY